MKYLAYILFPFLASFSQEFEFTPIQLNLYGIEIKGDTILCNGDFGSLIVSFDNTKNWHQVRVFERGTILKLFIDKEEIIAFSGYGKISKSLDGGKKWNEVKDLNDTILALIRYSDGYLIRTPEKLMSIDGNYEIINEYHIASKYPLDKSIKFQYSSSMTYFKGNFVVEFENVKYYIFSSNLTLMEVLDFKKLNLCNYCFGYYQIYSDSNYFYCQVDNCIYRSDDLINFTKFTNEFNFNFKYGLYNESCYILKYANNASNLNIILTKVNSINSIDTITKFKSSLISNGITPTHFNIVGDRLWIVGKNKLISSYELTNGLLNYISDFSAFFKESIPEKLDETSFMFLNSQYNVKYYKEIYHTLNNCVTFKPSADANNNSYYDRFNLFVFSFYDSTEGILFRGGTLGYPDTKGGVFVSRDKGKTFEYKEIPDFMFSNYIAPVGHKIGKSFMTNVQKRDSFYITSNSIKYFNYYSHIWTFDLNFENVHRYSDSGFAVDYVYTSDTNNILISCLAYTDTDSTRQIKYTSNRGIDWNIIKLFDDTDSLLYYKEINFRSDKYLITYNFIEKDSLVTIEALDLMRKSIAKIYEYKLPDFSIDTKYSSGIASDAELIYLVVNDTLFYIDDLFDRKTWKYHIFPNNGRVIRTFAKFDDRFYARYRDDVNAENIYWIKITGEPIAPTPIISLSDNDFGVRDVSVAEAISKTLAIENLSDNASLTISAYSGPTHSEFWTDLPQIDSENPIVIAAKGKYDFNVFFKPTSKMIYSDSIIFHSDAKDGDSVLYLRGEGIDTAVSVIEYSVETQPYLWSSPPYPLPSSSEVRTIIYWDTISNIDDCEVNIYDIFGAKVAGKESTTIEKLTPYSGYLSWNCSGLSSGVYIINIIHGTQSIAIKAMLK